MKKSIFVVLSLLVIAMFLVGCVPQEELSQEDQQALDSELNEMSDEQLDQVIEDVESEGAIALAGQAYSKYKAIPKASRSRFLASAYKAKLARVKSKTTLQYALQDATIYEADVKLGGEVYPFSFNQGEQILTFKYWGTGETISIATTKSMGQYVGTFKVGGGSYPVSIDWGLQPPIMTLKDWPEAGGDLQYALQDATIYEADVKLGGEVYPFSFNQGEQILTFKYWGTGETISIAMTKSMGQYVGTFKVGGGSYPVSIDWGLQPPIMTLEGWPGTS